MISSGEAAFIAGLPTGDKGEPIPGHTTWQQLGPKAQERYHRMAQAAIDVFRVTTMVSKESN